MIIPSQLQKSSCVNIMGASPYHIEIILLCLLCALVMFKSVKCINSQVHSNERDMNTLLNFKQVVVDPSNLLLSWIPEKDCCQWKGVRCDNLTDRVTELSLPCHATPSPYSDKADKSHCLTGEFELSLLDLEFLKHLNLSHHDFNGIQYNPIDSQKCNNALSTSTPPLRCNNFSSLHYLDLSHNNDLPIDNLHWVSHLSSLQYLDLSGIHLQREIDWLPSVTMLPSLRELHLESCHLENIYPSLQYANFTSLEVLDISDNDFKSEFPGWIFNLSCDIFHIDLSQNHIHGQLPKTLPNFRSIKSLDLSENNYIYGAIPDWLGQLEHLEELDLSYNSLSGPIPTSLGNLSSLIVLHLESNLFNESLPENLGQLFNLEVLGVGDNNLDGVVSERNFRLLSNLKHLYLSSPALISIFDPKWIPPFELEGIRLSYMGLPSWLFTQSSLKTLTVTDTRISFEPQDKFWSFAELEFFCLDSNLIDADMSSVVLNSKVSLLSSNFFRGGLPQLSSNVSILSLHNNYFSGSISPLVCQKIEGESNLEYLDISDNLLSGELTNCWARWKSLVHINLGNNFLTGKIPNSMGFLSNLISLHLYGNKFFGEVPLPLKNCQNLSILNLGENNLSGPIPIIGQGAKALILRSNEFSGNIPPQICQLHSLMVLDFADNRLSGSIPNCLHNMTAMVYHNASTDGFHAKVANIPRKFLFPLRQFIKGVELEYFTLMQALDLSSNNLSGAVPLEVFQLTSLLSLNLSSNQLVGVIPEEIGNLNQLESLDLSRNRLSGQIPQSMSSLYFLGVLNLSFNNFTGQIPFGTQLQGFSNLSYMGNPGLCGPPLTYNCDDEQFKDEKLQDTQQMREDDDTEDSEVHSWFYMGLGIGFPTGFFGTLGVIFFNKRCRLAYSRIFNRLHVTVIQN